ncbi:MAG: M23 family metallopeptidase [Beutenbergiaceae bacterium]
MSDTRESATQAFPTRRELRLAAQQQARAATETTSARATSAKPAATKAPVPVAPAQVERSLAQASMVPRMRRWARLLPQRRSGGSGRWLPRVAVLGGLALATTAIPLSGVALPADSANTATSYAAVSALDVLAQEPINGTDSFDPSSALVEDPLAGVRAMATSGRSEDREVLQCGSSELEANGQVAAGATTEPIQVMMPLTSGSYRVTSNYGYRWGGQHEGLDFAAPTGTPIHAVAAGEVTYIGYGLAGRSGMIIILEHNVDGEQFWTWYVHSYPDGIFVDVGERVGAGEVIAEVGNYGNSTGPHLHFEVHTDENYTTVNPATWLSQQSAATVTTQNLACAADE